MSKRAEALTSLRAMSAHELGDHIVQLRRRLFEIRFQQATGQVERHRQIRHLRLSIAQAMTVQIEAERAGTRAAGGEEK